MKYLLLSLSFLLAPTLYAQWTIESVPNQKLVNGSYVSNPDGILTEATTASIDALLQNLEDSTTVQVAVVAVKSIGDADIFTFAQDLFSYWGIGQKDNDNGLLILLVEDTHTIRFHTGYGLESVLTDARCKHIQQEYMVPLFKEGDYNGGMLAGVGTVVKVINDPAYADEVTAEETSNGMMNDYAGTVAILCFFVVPILAITFGIKLFNKSFSDSKSPAHTDYPEMRVTRLAWALEFLAAPAIIVAAIGLSGTDQPFVFALLLLYLYSLVTLIYRQWRMKRVMQRLVKDADYHGVVEFLRSNQVYWLFMGLLYPLPFLPYFFYHLARKRRYRNHPRTCSSCQGNMVKLDEQADDAYLSKAQQIEENIRSVDYDVWQCAGCQDTEVWNYPNRSSRYKKCSYCDSQTSFFISRKTLRAASYSSSGQGEEIYGCVHCGKRKRKTYSIAKLEHSSSSSSSSSGSGSSSSSGGGSWGGGSSGGGGASSSW
jgi:uncharacterized protein